MFDRWLLLAGSRVLLLLPLCMGQLLFRGPASAGLHMLLPATACGTQL
jgi:hypothetical protein